MWCTELILLYALNSPLHPIQLLLLVDSYQSTLLPLGMFLKLSPCFREPRGQTECGCRIHVHSEFCGRRVFEWPYQQPFLFVYQLHSSPFPPIALLTNDCFPLPVGLRDFVGAAHLAEGHTADDEDHHTRPGAVLSGCLVLVPVAITSTAVQETRITYVISDFSFLSCILNMSCPCTHLLHRQQTSQALCSFLHTALPLRVKSWEEALQPVDTVSLNCEQW